jgi:hypothetical protein
LATSRRPLKRGKDCFQHRLDILEDLGVRRTYDAIAFSDEQAERRVSAATSSDVPCVAPSTSTMSFSSRQTKSPK